MCDFKIIMMKRIFVFFTAIALFLNVSAQDKFTDARDGNTYKTITIAGMTWMAENLKYTAEGSGANYFDNDPNNLTTYGVLYEWQTAVRACPDGWHVPSFDDWKTLFNLLGESNAGKKLQGGFSCKGKESHWWSSEEIDTAKAQIIYLDNKTYKIIISAAQKTDGLSVRCIRDK